MKPIENYKDVEINGRTFRIKKFDAMTGSFMLIKITGIIAPMLKGVDLKKLSESDGESFDFDYTIVLAEIGNLSEKDFTYVQEKCLQVCSEMLSAGMTPVLNKNGTFGVIGLEDDTVTIMALTIHALAFNVKGFFQGSPLASLLGGLLNTSSRS
jgi:hypothetical protein